MTPEKLDQCAKAAALKWHRRKGMAVDWRDFSDGLKDDWRAVVRAVEKALSEETR